MTWPFRVLQIDPTGTCFDDALEYTLLMWKSQPAMEIRLAHGICTTPKGFKSAGVPFAHAWVECDLAQLVFQSGFVRGGANDGMLVYYPAPRDGFYRVMEARDVTLYTPAEADKLNERTLHFGPWEERYLPFCKPREGVAQ